jgi:hypothetical protein
VPSKRPIAIAACSFLALSAAASSARADASAWVFVGAGALGWKQGEASTLTPGNEGKFGANAMMTIDVGAGTSPDASFIFGGLFRIQPIFKQGADLAILARACSHGFQAGDFGFAIDAGGYLRTWGPVTGAGFTGGVSLGLPLGFTITAQAEVGSNRALAFGGVAGIDLLRLTVYRKTLLNWWQNPSPAPDKTASSGAAIRF